MKNAEGRVAPGSLPRPFVLNWAQPAKGGELRMIRRATGHDIDTVQQIYMELFAWERRHEAYSKWVSGVYPNRTTIRRAVAKQEMYALWDEKGEGKKIYAAMAISREQPEDYARVNWKFRAPPRSVVVVRALCVSPLRFREGLGTQMMHFVMETASRMRCRAVRFDVWSGNVPAVSLCEKLGFRCAGRKNAVRFSAGADERAYYEWAPAGGEGNGTGRASFVGSQGKA